MAYITSTASVTTQLGMIIQLMNNTTISTGLNPYTASEVLSQDLESYTLNAKYLQGASLETGGVDINNPPKLQYFGIGVGGIKASDRGLFVNSPKSTNADLFAPIPLLAITQEQEHNIRTTDVGTDPNPENLPGKQGDIGDKAFLNTFRMRVEKGDYVMFYLKEISDMSVSIINVTPGGAAVEGTLDPKLNPASSTVGHQENTQQVAKIEGLVSLNNPLLRTVIEAFGYQDTSIFPEGTQADTALHISEIGIYSGVEVDGVSTTEGDDYTEAGFCHLQFHKCWSGHSLNDEGPEWSTTVILENGSLALF